MKESHPVLSRLSRDALLAVLLVAACALAVYKVGAQLPVGPWWDAYSFLLNALTFAGEDFAYFEFSRSPLFPYLLSLAFRAGHDGTYLPMYLDAAFAVAGTLCMYALVRQRYGQVPAFLSGLFFLFPVVMVDWVGRGYADIGSVAFSLAAVALFVAGVERHPRYFVLAWPMVLAAFLMRSTAALIVVPLAYYALLLGGARIRYVEHLAGIGLSALIFVPVMRFYAGRTGDPLYLVNAVFSGFGKSTETTGSVGEIYAYGRLYFAESLPAQFVGERLFPFMAALLVFGILVLVSSYVTEHRLSFTEVLVPLFCCVVFVLVLLYAPYFVGQVVLFGLLLVLAPYARRTPRGVFFAMMLLWGASYFLFHSLYFQKVVRYYLPMLPGLAFIAAVAVDAAARKVGAVISHPRAGAALVVLASMGMLFYGAYGAVGDTHLDAEAQVNAANEEVAGYLATRLAGSPLIYSDYWVITGWMLGYPVYAMPVFSDEPAFAHELHKYRVDFYASYRDWYFEGYERVFSATEYYVFERRDAVEKPRGLYIGNGWQNYFERLTGYAYYLMDGTIHIEEGSDYLDDYTLEELQSYDFVAAFGFKWHDRKAADQLLQLYVYNGGTLVIDTSGNTVSSGYPIGSSVFLKMNVLRSSIKVGNEVSVSLGGDVPALETLAVPSGTWYGDTYLPVSSDSDVSVLATVDGNTLLALERFGDGTIFWMGYNYLFFTSQHGTGAEEALVSLILSGIVPL
ncbi:MAG: glycosyltransferase family 39 protein [Candidatus Methanofastidiosa archaeon]|nr:glycosyltransferase family 39 protein [Candidatus Methanofastidiosa archaeon]